VTRTSAKGRTRPCSAADARKRVADAEKYYEVAQLVASEAAFVPSVTVAAGLAVLAGIAAADAACCAALGRSSRSYDHADAGKLLATVSPGGAQAARDFTRVIGVKDTAHYGFLHIAGADLKALLRRTSALVSFAEQTVERHR
jgi:hypothetical protein